MLKLFEPSLENVPAPLRTLYVADADHGWRLDCDYEKHVRGLKTALRAERSARRVLQGTISRTEVAIVNARRDAEQMIGDMAAKVGDG